MVIDWLGLEIRALTPTNFMSIRRELATLQRLPEGATAPHVDALDAGAGGAASVFRFRLQDPGNHRAIVTLMARLGERFPLQCPPVVTGIEVAFDTACPGASALQLAGIIAQRQRWTARIPGHDWNLYRKEGQGRIYLNAINRYEFIQHLTDGWQLTDATDKTAPVRIHAYVKTTDAGLKLESCAWRARFEVTLTGSALPCTTLDQLERFDFTALAEFFQFRRYTDTDPHPAIAHARGWSGITQPGRRGPYRRRTATIARYSGTREYRSYTSPDGPLNAQIYALLRKLDRSWRSGRK